MLPLIVSHAVHMERKVGMRARDVAKQWLKMSKSADGDCVMRLPVRARDAASWYSLFRNKL